LISNIFKKGDIVKRYFYFLGIVIAMIVLTVFIINNNKSTTISLKKAEQIALSKAGKDGYRDAKVWTRYNSKTMMRYIFSSEENRDIKVWQVNIDAAHNPPIKNAPAASYYISKKDGSIVSVIRGLTQAGMDLEISGIELNAEDYHFKIKNKGNIDYTIEWIEPYINPKKQSSIQGKIRKIELMKTIPVNTELSLQPEANKDIIGFNIKVKEENEPILIIDNYYRNVTDL
jgi:hypothetical protein